MRLCIINILCFILIYHDHSKLSKEIHFPDGKTRVRALSSASPPTTGPSIGTLSEWTCCSICTRSRRCRCSATCPLVSASPAPGRTFRSLPSSSRCRLLPAGLVTKGETSGYRRGGRLFGRDIVMYSFTNVISF